VSTPRSDNARLEVTERLESNVAAVAVESVAKSTQFAKQSALSSALGHRIVVVAVGRSRQLGRSRATPVSGGGGGGMDAGRSAAAAAQRAAATVTVRQPLPSFVGRCAMRQGTKLSRDGLSLIVGDRPISVVADSSSVNSEQQRRDQLDENTVRKHRIS